MKNINTLDIKELTDIEVCYVPPYSLFVPNDKITERGLEPPTGELFYIETPMGDIFF